MLDTKKLLWFNKLDAKPLRVFTVSDAPFANNLDMTSQLGHIIFLTDNTSRKNILSCSSYNSKRVVRSELGETYAFVDAFDA